MIVDNHFVAALERSGGSCQVRGSVWPLIARQLRCIELPDGPTGVDQHGIGGTQQADQPWIVPEPHAHKRRIVHAD